MKKLCLTVAATAAIFAAATSSEAVAEGVSKSTMSGSCENWSLSSADLKACNEQMTLAKTDSDRMEVQKRFMKGTNTSGVNRGATTDTSASRSETGPTANPGGLSNPGSTATTPGSASGTDR